MRIRKRMAIVAVVLMAGATMAATVPAATQEGSWTATVQGDGRMQLMLHWDRSNWGHAVALTDLVGISAQQIAAPVVTPVAFRIERDAGLFQLDGSFRQGRGSGRFRFDPNRGFVSTLVALEIVGAARASDLELMQLAISDVSARRIRDLVALGFTPLTIENLVEIGIFDVTPEYVRSLRAAGVAGTSSVSDVVEMRIHGLDADFVRAMEAEGLRGLSRDDLVELSIHGVTPSFVREMRQAGFAEQTTDALVEMRIHGLTPGFIRDLEALGYRGLSRQTLLSMRIHDVSPAFIREMRDAGFPNLSVETLVRMKIHGIDSSLVRGAARAR